MENFLNKSWNEILSKYSIDRSFNKASYHKLLCSDYPDFIDEYILCPTMKHLEGIGLLCGTDWTPLYKNRFYYSRLDHSIGVALMVWNFTKNKKQTLSALFHDISTQVFSHVTDFRKGDALTQSISENETEAIMFSDARLMSLLKRDGISLEEVSDYHIYPICDNERPRLSADRLEYMFPSGASLHGSWILSEVEEVYRDIKVLTNEDNLPELGFMTEEIAYKYFYKFLETSHLLQLNENKLTLSLLADITRLALEMALITEDKFYTLTEKEVMDIFLKYMKDHDDYFSSLVHKYTTMTRVEHLESKNPLLYNVSVEVKMRYIDPLVMQSSGPQRLTSINTKSKELLEGFLAFRDTPYGAV